MCYILLGRRSLCKLEAFLLLSIYYLFYLRLSTLDDAGIHYCPRYFWERTRYLGRFLELQRCGILPKVCVRRSDPKHMASTRVCLHLAVSQLESRDQYTRCKHLRGARVLAVCLYCVSLCDLLCVFKITAVFSPV